eukprot:1479868-Amphidinium_carterae.1
MAGLLTFGTSCQERITPFFVPKKSGQLRIVWDCRIMNLRFKPPPEMPMATGAVLAEVSYDKEDQLWGALSDIPNFFYWLVTPEWL